MAINNVQTGNANLFLEGYEVATNAAAKTRTISWSLYLRERVSSPYSWSGGGIGASLSATVNGADQGALWSGSFGFDFRPGGMQTQVIAEGQTVFGTNPDGSGSVLLGASIAATGSSDVPGGVSVLLTIPVTTLKVRPNVPSGVSATRLSDTQVRINWTNSGASNGQATQNVIQRRKNGGAWDSGTGITASSTATVNAAANEKWEYRIAARNAAGTTSYSAITNAVYTTPAAPTSVIATKQTNLDITVGWTPNVGYSEHEHEVWHGSVAAGVTTWDTSALATLPSGVSSYTHAAPNASQVHIYRVRAKAGTLLSAYAESNTVQLLVAPNKPTVPAIPAFADKALAFTFSWVHNPQDTSPQTAYEFSYSTNGGTSWTSTGKVSGSVAQRVIAAGAYAANVTLTMRVRTWGSATTGGSDGTGASPWSDVKSVTFKTRPATTITAPANGATLSDATVRVNLTFAQAEGATFVKAELRLSQTTGGTVVLEDLETTQLVGTTLATLVDNATSYTLRARVLDSNGIWSNYVTNTFSVTYLPPALPVVTLDYLEDTGWGQINITTPDPSAGQSAVATITITRKITGEPEEILTADFPASDELTFFDTTPTIHGTNTYVITATTALGAQRIVTRSLVTEECRKAFLSKGGSYSNVVVFGANLEVDESLSVASATVQTAGRTKPIGLYGIETSVQLKVKSYVFENFGSTLDELRAFLLMPGKTCFRDSTGRRTFGTVNGSVDYKKTTRGDLKFTLTETS